MKYEEDLKANRRLCILKLLLEDEGHSNISIIDMGMKALGHRVGVDRAYIADQLAHLAEQKCVVLEEVKGVTIVELTETGANVARGFAKAEGVARPSFRQ